MSSTTLETVPARVVRSRPGEPAWEIALLFPSQGHWSEAEYLALDTNRLVELVDGCLEVLPMPTPYHQLLVQFLFKLLDAFVAVQSQGKVFVAPMPIRLWEGRIREPDIMYLRWARLTDLTQTPHGADLAVEVVSDGEENRKRDVETKRNEYAQAGIAEYWIVDPEEKRITVLVLDGQAYREHGVFGPGSQATSVLLPGFAVSVDAVLAAGQLP